MAEAMNIRLDRILSSKVTPVMTAETLTETISEEHVISVLETSPIDGGDEFSGERNPQDRWLPITESRNGTTLRAAFHLLCSGIGYQALLLPIAFISLGWSWGIISLSLAFSWQLYTTWLLVNLHESSPQTGIRFSRYLHISIVAFGEKLGKLLGLFPTMYLSTGTCIVFIITGGNVMELLFQIICDDDSGCKAKTLTGTQWFLLFMCIAIFAAQFFPNLNSLAVVSAIGSITAVFYCFLLWVMSVDKGRVHDPVKTGSDDDGSGFRDVLNGLGIIALAFRGHNLVLEIQGTIPTNRKKPSRKSMWRGVIISYLLIAMCMYPIAIVGHWAYENKVYPNLGILTSFINFHRKSTPKLLTGAICLAAIIHYLCAYQIYAMPALDNFERIYVTKKNKPCPRWVRSAIKVLFGGFTYFVSVALPFLPSLGLFIGSLAMPLTLAYPCMMWVVVKKPVRFSMMWCINVVLGVLGVVFCGVCAGGALWSLIVDGLDANFFKPK
ncbi:lysine histidine transporter-like 8 [Phtheirospermum japonicum]|uniref:Lysine histidine transporter-like 8 n=1 Tax=Phtheirospermum japonicum TaxID=374723 RepID=A0A830D3Z6_9LAMI|nr:lysine histidine transporter-like 8 [Phtheirospermum japonicum]